MNGLNISYDLAMQYKNKSSILYHTSTASYYRGSIAGLVNSIGTATRIQIETIIDPDSEDIVPFIVNTRKLLDDFSSSHYYYNHTTVPMTIVPVNTYLFGGYTTTYDLQVLVYTLVPYLVVSTLVAVLILIFISFGSIALTLRLLITVCLSLTWAYGFMGEYECMYDYLYILLTHIYNYLYITINI